MNPNDVLGELIEKGQNATSNAVKSTVSDISDSVSGQIGVKNEANVKAQAQTQSQPQDQAQQQPGEASQNSIEESQRTKEMVRDFYSPSDDLTQSNPQTPATEEQQLAQVRQKLHQELHNEVYFNAILNADAPKQQEESKTDQLERQDKQELQELQQKEADKPPPLAVTRAQTHTEMSPGIAG